MHIKADNFNIGGQFIERVLKKNIDGIDGLKEARSRMIESSPLYFVDKFRNIQVHYGMEDRSVLAINGGSLLKKIRIDHLKLPGFSCFFHAGEGHDTDKNIYFPHAREAFLKLLE